ncbi:MAG: CRISPR-associated protein Cas4 [Bdellovibrio sp.]|nr:CRISPR-associated protein Cas4 [Bdellovibrio sp.]
MEKNYFGISLLSEYVYCQRSFAYRLIEFKPHEDENYFIVDGRSTHQRLDDKKVSYNREGLPEKRSIYVKSEKIQATGKIDRVIYCGDTVRIIEEKRGRLRSNEQHDLQCQLEAYCFEETFPEPKIEACLIYYQKSRRTRTVAWDNNAKNKIETLYNEIKDKCKDFALSKFDQVFDSRCSGCMFEKTCGAD